MILILILILLLFTNIIRLSRSNESFKQYPKPEPYPSLNIHNSFLGGGSFAIDDFQFSWGNGSYGNEALTKTREWDDIPYGGLATPGSGDPTGDNNLTILHLTKDNIILSAGKKEKPYSFIVWGKCKEYKSNNFFSDF